MNLRTEMEGMVDQDAMGSGGGRRGGSVVSKTVISQTSNSVYSFVSQNGLQLKMEKTSLV